MYGRLGTPLRSARLRLLALLIGAAVGAAGAFQAAAVGVAGAFEAATRAQPDAGAQAGCLMVPIEERDGSRIQGTAHLCWNPNGVRVNVRAESLTPDHAYTVWFVHFDRPAACKSTPCAVPDVLGDDPVGVVSRMDGVVAGGTGQAHFAGDFRDLRLSGGSEVHLPVFGHGPAHPTDNRALARQLLTPQNPVFGAPMGGAPADGVVGQPRAVAIFNLP